MSTDYKFNSKHKETIRSKWVEFMRAIENPSLEQEGLSVITFPSSEMHDLRLFVEEGLITWEETETGGMRITKGKVICFEKDGKKFNELSRKLISAKVHREFNNHIVSNCNAILNGKDNTFPVDAINLDYEKSISKNETPIDIIVSYLFRFQRKYARDFVLFLTWPKPFEMQADQETYVNLWRQVIKNNLEDQNAKSFKSKFENSFSSIETLAYENLSIIGLTKQIIRESSNNNFQLTKNEFFSYGEEGRQPMMSVMYLFKHINSEKPQPAIYSEDVSKALETINYLSKKS